MLFSTPLSEYKDLSCSLDEWLVTIEEVPEVFAGAVGDVSIIVDVRDVLLGIRRAREILLSGPAQKPTSFADSRLSSFEEVLRRDLDSCGVRVRVFGTVLRVFGVPVRFVSGKRVDTDLVYDHAWLDIYSPRERAWVEVDPSQDDFGFSVKNQRKAVFHHWEELRVTQ